MISKKELKNNAIIIIYVQIKALKGHAEIFKGKLNYALKEANYSKLDQKYEKNQVLDF